MKPIRLAHFSDPHLPHEPRLSWRQKLSKRQLSAWSWQRARRKLQRGDVLGALLADLRTQGADHIAVTGDITNFSLPDEFAAAAGWLGALGAARDVTAVPGNHDALVALDWREGLGRWRPWLAGDEALNEDGGDTPLHWPTLRRRGALALIGLNSAVPTLPALAGGRLGAAQLAKLEALLNRLRDEGCFRCVMLHHPPADGAVSARKALADRAALRDVLRCAGAELVLHGHARDARFDALAGPADQGGPILCLGLPSASAIPSHADAGARWHALTLNAAPGGWRLQVAVRLWSPDAAGFVSGGTYRVAIPRTHAASPQ